MRRKLTAVCLFVMSIVITVTVQISLEREVQGFEKVNSGQSIRFYDGGWENIQINSAIAMYIIENGYDKPTEIIEMRAPEMQASFEKGELDVNMEMWRILMNRWVTEQLEAKKIVDRGPTYEAGIQGFYVPTYIIEGDSEKGIEPLAPKLKSVQDLITYKDLFSNHNESKNGFWLNCMQGWPCRKINRIKMASYGIDSHFKPIEPKDESEWNEWIINAYEKGKPFVTYYWDPSPLMGLLKMTKLEEPKYTKECWDEIERVLSDFEVGKSSEKACAYQTISVHKFVSYQLQKEAPEIAEFFKKMFVGTDRVRELGGYMKKNNASPQETALYFLNKYDEQWREWVPKDVYQKIRASL